MRAVLKHPQFLNDAELAVWAKLRAGREAYGSPFLSSGYAIAAGEAREDARVLFGMSGARVDLILPLQVSQSGLVRPLGAPMSDVNGPILRTGVDACVLPKLLADAGVAAFAFNGWRGQDAKPGVRGFAREGCAVADLSRGFEAWLEAQRDLHPKHFKKMRRLARQAEKDFGAVEVRFGAPGAGEMETLIAWKRAQFVRTGRHDILRADWTRALLKWCAGSQEDDFAGVMASLYLGGKLAAAEFGLRSGDVLHGWFAGYDPAFASCSPGLILQEKLLEEAARAGVKHAVLGVGETHYKHHYMSWQAPLDSGLVAADGLAGRARAATGDLWRRVERGTGRASEIALRTRRRLDVILAVETKAGDQIGGFLKAVRREPAVASAAAAVGALTTAAPMT